MQTLRWHSRSDFNFDVAEFEQALASGNLAHKVGRLTEARTHWETAALLYRGPLLPSCYDDWITLERERLGNGYSEVLTNLIEHHTAASDFAAAIRYADRLVKVNPLDENVQLRLMQLHASARDRAGVIRAFRAYTDSLTSELQIAPSRSVQEHYENSLRLAEQPTVAVNYSHAFEVPTPLVGRQSEWALLQSAWQQAFRGQAGMVLIRGEAGIGKTRLAEELMIWAGRQSIRFARTRAYAAEGRLAYAPIVEWLRAGEVYTSIKSIGKVWLPEVARVLPELQMDMPELILPQPLIDQSQRQIFYEAMARAVLADRRPLLLVIDDLQWCDVETLEWIRYLLRFDLSAPILIVGTVRSEEVDAKHPLNLLVYELHQSKQLSEIALQRFNAAETTQLANFILEKPAQPAEATQIYDNTEGNPLFVVEMARAGLGVKPADSYVSPLALPPRIHALILSRFAQLSDLAVEIMHLGATTGRAFHVEILVGAGNLDEESILQGLDELWQRKIVSSKDESVFDFTHDKLREVAYGQLGLAKRRLLHRRVAKAMETVYAGDLDPISAQLAFHCEQAGIYEQAIEYYIRAAQFAGRLFAHNEVGELIKKGRELILKLVTGFRRDDLEMQLCSIISLTVIQSSGWQVPEQLEALERAQQLGNKLGKRTDLTILKALAINKLVQNDFVLTSQIARQFLELGEESQDTALLLQGHQLLGLVTSWLGDFQASRFHLEHAISYYDSEKSSFYITSYSWDPKVVSQCRLALTIWYLGYPDQALQMQQVSLELAYEIRHPFSLGYSLTWNTLLLLMSGDMSTMLQQAQLTIDTSKKDGVLWWLRFASVLYGCGLVRHGRLAEGVAVIEQGITDWISLGNHINHVMAYGYLAYAYFGLGQKEKGFDLIDHALELCKTRERWFEAEIHRLHGEMLLATDAEQAEAAYLRAISLADIQSAKSLELRATVSLAKLWQSQGRLSDAAHLLQPIYDWFSEGHETFDLKDAKALLSQLTLS